MALQARNQADRRPGTWTAPAIFALLVSLLVPTGAAAKIVVDPEGPAAKQYSAIHDRQREKAAGDDGTAGVPGSTARAPLFGEGIRPGSVGPGKDQAKGQGNAEQGDSGQSLAIAPGDEEGTTLKLAGISLAVLALGGLLGFGIQRLQPSA